MNLPRPLGIGLLIIVPAVLRALQFEWNLVPIGALALFCGAHYRKRWLALVIPIAAMALGDVLLGVQHHDVTRYVFHPLLPVVYGCYAISVAMGMGLRRYWDRIESPEPGASGGQPGSHWRFSSHIVPIAATTLAGSAIFFLVTNFGEWLLYDTYAKTWHGLGECYLAAVPFFERTLAGDAAGSILLFGASYLLELKSAAELESERI
jgi:hypothetical protein